MKLALLVIAVLALAGSVSAAHHQKTYDDLSKTCKKTYDNYVKDFAKEDCSGISDVRDGAGALKSDKEVNSKLKTYCEENGKCYKLFEQYTEELETDCADELNYEDEDTANFWLIDWYYPNLVDWTDYLCTKNSDDDYCLVEAYEFNQLKATENATTNAAYCNRAATCYEDTFMAHLESVSFLIDYPKSDVGKAVNVVLNYNEDFYCKDDCLAEVLAANAQWNEWAADGFSDIQADNKKIKEADVDSFYEWYENTWCGTCRAYISDMANEISAVSGAVPTSTVTGCDSDGRGSFCTLREAQTETKWGAGAIACPTGDDECAAAQDDKAVYGKDRDACDAVFFADAAQTVNIKCSKECKKVAEPLQEYLGCCVSATWRSIFAEDENLIDNVTIINSFDNAGEWWTDCGGTFDAMDYCESRVSSSYTIELHGIDISSASEKEIDMLIEDITLDIANYLLGGKKDIADVEVTVSSDDDEHVEVEITVTHDESITTFAAAKMNAIDETSLPNTEDNKLADKKGIEVEGVTTSLSGVFSVVPTVFALLCAVVALLF